MNDRKGLVDLLNNVKLNVVSHGDNVQNYIESILRTNSIKWKN